MISTIMVCIGYLDNAERETEIISSLNKKLRYVSDETKDPLKKLNADTGGRASAGAGLMRSDWMMYAGTADRLEVEAFIKYFMEMKLYSNDHMQLFISRDGATNFESYWNGGGDAQTQFHGNANWKRGR